MSKNRLRIICGREIWTQEFLLSFKFKTVVFTEIPNGGRDRIRTCDPALIKRML